MSRSRQLNLGEFVDCVSSVDACIEFALGELSVQMFDFLTDIKKPLSIAT